MFSRGNESCQLLLNFKDLLFHIPSKHYAITRLSPLQPRQSIQGSIIRDFMLRLLCLERMGFGCYTNLNYFKNHC